jgi:hypothetical protein
MQVCAWAPEVLLLCPCSRSPAAAMPDVERLVARPGFRDLPAVASGRVYLIDHSYFSRPGPRLVDGVELLYNLLWELPHGHVGASHASAQPPAAAVDPVPDVDRGLSGLSFQGALDTTVTTGSASASERAADSAQACSAVGAVLGVDCSWRRDVLRIQYHGAKGTCQWVLL